MASRGAGEGALTGLLPVAPIARGGMGTVELVLRREGVFRRVYAVKRLHAHYREDSEFRTMFLEEARIAGLLRHPNVVSVLDVGEDALGPFLLMDYVDGVPLANVIATSARSGDLLPVEVCLDIGEQVATGLHAAHELRDHAGNPMALVHRDVSPQNVLISFDGTCHVTDFGIAKVIGSSVASTGGALLKGKIGYMAPEQLRFEKLDRRSDLFALGVVLYELLTGRRLHPGADAAAMARSVLHDPPPDPQAYRADLPNELVELLFELLCKDREGRPADAAIVASRLRAVRASLGGDESLRLVAFMAREYAELRRARDKERADAVARAEIASEPRLTSPSRARAPLLVAAALALAVAGAVVFAWAIDGGAETAEPARAAQESIESPPDDGDPRAPAEVAPAAGLERPVEADVEPSVEPSVEGPDVEASRVEVVPGNARVRRARRAASGQRPAAPVEASARPSDRLWRPGGMSMRGD